MDGNEAIAIVGIGCKFPGADNADEYWKLLLNAQCELKDIPRERFNVDAFYDENPSALGKTYVRKAALIDRPFDWDNQLFGYNENEAAAMDPQQRYVLDCVHMALEDGGLTKKDMSGTNTSVYIGAMNADYQAATTDDESLLSNYSVTGISQSIMSARVSYHYNLLGPSMTIDTACSSSLVAIHLGSESIKSGESTMAICGGVSSILYPEMFITLSRARMASPTGLCQTFSADADGYARGEGCGVVVLEKLGDAIRNGHKIWGTIQTGCNQDGQTTKPITAPSGAQQIKLLQKIYNKNNIDPSHIQYIEAHGTGTPVGDPIETSSLGEFFKSTPVEMAISEKYRIIGSVKTNIGHLESAAGIAGLMKVLLMMKHGQVVPSLHSENLNPLIDFNGFQFQIPKQIYPWYPIQNQFRMACINCFGFGGTNAHAVIKQTIDRESTHNIHEKAKYPVIVTLSGQTSASLKQIITHFRDSVNNGSHSLLDIAYTSTLRRDHFRYRVAYTCRTHVELSQKCSASINKSNEDLSKVGTKRHCFFVFCGVGTTWTGMCKEMLSNSVFEDTLSEIDLHLEKLSGWSIKEKLSNQVEMKNSMMCHIAIFACQVGLAKVWESFGIIPDAVVGQSVGEVASAYVAGYLSLEDAVRVIYFRSLLLSMAEGGVMMVVRNCPLETVETLCRNVKSGSVNIAVHSSPVACTVSGDAIAIEELKNNLSDLGQENQPVCTHLDVKCAYHSHHVRESAGKIAKALDDLKTHVPKLTAYSTVTGDVASQTLFATKGYWEENVRSEVKFSQALRNMASEKGVNVFIEVGPKPVLRVHANNIFPDRICRVLPSMQPSGEISTMYQTVADLFEIGFDPIWETFYPQQYKLVDIPRYKFDRKELRVESEYQRLRCEGVKENKAHHKLLKNSSKSLENFKVAISPDNTPFVYNHIIDGAIVVPGALYAEVALELGASVIFGKTENMAISYDILNFVPISQRSSCELEVIKSKLNEDGGLTFSISHSGNVVVEGSVLCNTTGNFTNYCPISQIMKSCQKSIEAENIYSELERIGYTYTPPVQVLQRLLFNQSESLAEISLTEDVMKTVNRYIFHPAVLDGMLHSQLLLFMRNCKTPNVTKIYPVRIGRLVIKSQLEKNMLCYSRNIQARDNKIISNFLLTDENGIVIAEVKEMEFKVVDDTIPLDSVVHDVHWTPIDNQSLSNEAEFDEHKIQIISLQEDVLNTLKGVFPGCKTQHVKYDANNEKSFEETQDLLKSIFDDNGLSIIIFASGKENHQTSEETFEAIRKSCHVFLCIAKAFNPKIPLLVLTEDTQNVPGFQVKDPNIFGAELWGYVRSLRLETSFPVSLLDIQLSQNTTQRDRLRSFVRNVKDITLSYSIDIVLTDEQMFRYSFLRNSERKGLKREYKRTDIDDNRIMELRSTTHESVLKPFLVPCEEKEGNRKGVLLRVQSATHLQVVPSDKHCVRGIWSESEDSGFPVLAYEHYGVKIKSKTMQSPLTEQKRYAACFPERCSSLVTIPAECICDIQKLAFYKAGIITSFVTAWSIFQNITGSQTVYIVDNEPEQTPEGIILTEILKQRRGNVILFSPEQFLNYHSDKERIVVFLTNSMIDEISVKLQNVRSIIGFSDVISESTKRILILQNNGVKLLYRTEIFDQEALKSSFPVIRAFMEKNQSILQKAIPYVKMKEVHLTSNGCNPDSSLSLHLKPQQIVSHDACYIVVGGLTGLGWEVVKWLARMGAGAVITMSRRKPDNETIEKIQNVIYRHRIRIITLQCDVCCLSNVKSAVRNLHKMTNLPLKGVYQGAGILRDGYINSMTKEKIDAVLLPKVLGTLNLHAATLHLSLDQFVLQSSVASVLGSPGQTSYSAANAFLDAFSHFRRSQNCPSQSVNWGALEVGMVGNNVAVKDQLENMGHNALNKKQIKLSLSEVVLKNQVQAAYASIDFKKLGITYQTKKVNSEIKKAIGYNSSIPFDAVAFDLDLSAPKEKNDRTLKLIVVSASKVLSIEESDVEQDNSLVNQGLESQQATEFIQLVYEATGCKLPIAYVISPQYSVKDIAEFAALQTTENQTNEKEKRTLKKSISLFEKAIMDIISDGDNIELSIDYEVTKSILTEETWKDILRFLTFKHPELRTFFKRDRHSFAYGIEKIILEPEDVVLNFKVAPLNTDREASDERPTETEFHLFTNFETPIKIFFTPRREKHRLQISFNPISFDLESAFLLTMEMCHLAEEVKSKRCLPEVKELPEVDVSFLTDKALREASIDLKRFWESQISTVTEKATLSKSDRSPSTTKESTSRDLPITIVKQLTIAEIDQSKFFCCLYGLLLSKVTSVPSVPIVCANNVRRHLQELDRRIFMGTNFFPAVLTIDNQDISLMDYVESATAIFNECDKHGLYPYELIKELTGSQPNLFKHQFNYRTFPLSLNGCSNRGYKLVKCSCNFPTMSDMETCLNISNYVDKGEVELRLDYDTGILDCDQAGTLLEDLQGLIIMFAEKPWAQVKDYHPKSHLPWESLESKEARVTAL